LFNPQKSHRHPALRGSAFAYTVYGHRRYLIAKVQIKNESSGI